MRRPSTRTLAITGALGLAGATGAIGAVAVSSSSAQAPTKTTTITIPSASTGGAENCPTGSTFQSVVLNQPGGHTELWVCVAG